jgi:hypothetical protein
VEIFSFGRSLSRTATLAGQGTLPTPYALFIGIDRSDKHLEQPAPNLIVFFSQFEGVVGIDPLNPGAVRSYCRSFALEQRAQRPHRRRDDRPLRIPLSW